MNDKTGRVTGVHSIGVPVTDQDHDLQFYVDTLGRKKRLDVQSSSSGGRWIEVHLPALRSRSASFRSATTSQWRPDWHPAED